MWGNILQTSFDQSVPHTGEVAFVTKDRLLISILVNGAPWNCVIWWPCHAGLIFDSLWKEVLGEQVPLWSLPNVKSKETLPPQGPVNYVCSWMCFQEHMYRVQVVLRKAVKSSSLWVFPCYYYKNIHRGLKSCSIILSMFSVFNDLQLSKFGRIL